MNLAEKTARIHNLLRSTAEKEVVDPKLYDSLLWLRKSEWDSLGDTLREAESHNKFAIEGRYWITLRLDAKGFGKRMKELQRQFGLARGWKPEISNIMATCLEDLMSEFGATVCGYTQSDEMTVILKPASVVRGQQQEHAYNGRVMKYCSYAAARVSSRFNWEVASTFGKVAGPDSLVTFDCRLGYYETLDEAMALILWRSHDCSVNGVSDTVFYSGKDGFKKMMRSATFDKLEWLARHQLLPLNPRQSNGTYLVKRKRVHKGKHGLTGEEVYCLRTRVEQVEGNLLKLWKNGDLFPKDEDLPTK